MMIDQGQTNAHKDRYDGKYAKVDIMAVRGTANREVYFKQLILRRIKQLISFENQNVDSGLQ